MTTKVGKAYLDSGSFEGARAGEARNTTLDLFLKERKIVPYNIKYSFEA